MAIRILLLAAALGLAIGLGALPALLFPVACVLLHVGYGLGSLAGLARFASRWGDRRGGQRSLVRAPSEAAR